MSEDLETFVIFFKALADANRLKIVGLLARQPQSVEELAANLGVSSATVSHHLQRLQAADLVEARVRQYYNVYALRPMVMQTMLERLLAGEHLATVAPLVQPNAYAARVLDEYFTHGKLRALPSPIQKREIVLRHIAETFEPGKRYTEKRVHEMLKMFHSDWATLRAELVRLKWLAHADGVYTRTARVE